jgi:rhodanese-related sulfurtransferase
MQTVIHERYKLKILNQFDLLYSMVTTSNKQSFPNKMSASFKPLVDILSNYIFFNTDNIEYQNDDYNILNIPKNNVIVVCVSGGKDSTAAAKYYKNSGFDVKLFHMHGINKSYPNELENVKKVAEYLQMPLYVNETSVKGNIEWKNWKEHPLKNIIIACEALDYALENFNTSNICFGNFTQSRLADNDFLVCGGDCIEMWNAFENVIHKVIPEFKMLLPLRNNGETFEILTPKEIEICCSCMSPYRFQKHWRERTMYKYCIDLLPNRCGCCWKDCLEYIYLTDHNFLDFNYEYYLHCLQILCDTIAKESGEKPVDINEVWNTYFFYDMNISKIGGLNNAVIQNGKIKLTQ